MPALLRWSPLPPPAERRHPLIDGLDGGDVDATVDVVRRLLSNGDWRPWMLRALLRLHRHEVARLLSLLRPLLHERGVLLVVD